MTIGAAQGTTSIAKGGETLLSAAGATNQNGSSGGGGYYKIDVPWGPSTQYAPGTGGGTTTVPFGDTTNFSAYPCAGGGASGWYDYFEEGDQYSEGYSTGGAGGSNGSGGGASASGGGSGGSGGTTGGGAGATTSGTASSATYYGSAGGGAMAAAKTGKGYQGVMYIRVPAEKMIDPGTEETQGYRIYKLAVTNSWHLTANTTVKGSASIQDLTLYDGTKEIDVSEYDYIGYDTNNGNSSVNTSNLFDGNTATTWTGQTANGSPVWAQVIFPYKVKATSFALTLAQSGGTVYTAPNDFQLYGSNDNENFALIYNGSGIGKSWSSNVVTKTFPITYYDPGNGNGYQYYRLTVSNSYVGGSASTSAYAYINELRLYNGDELLDYGAAVYTCTDDSGNVGNPQSAFDGNDYSSWYSWSSQTAWLQVQLPAKREITAFTITCDTADTVYIPNNFTLAGSNDGTSFTTLYTATGAGASWGNTPTWRFTLGGGAEAVPEPDWTNGQASEDGKYMYYRLLLGTSYNTGGSASGTAGGKNSMMQLNEWALFNGEDEISYTGATYSIHSGTSATLGNVFDGDVSTSCEWAKLLGATDSMAGWIQVQLTAPVEVTAFALYVGPQSAYSGNKYYADVRLYGSNNGSDFVLLKETEDPTWTFGDNAYLKVTI